jgi:hypothetical protein
MARGVGLERSHVVDGFARDGSMGFVNRSSRFHSSRWTVDLVVDREAELMTSLDNGVGFHCEERFFHYM